jgi:hypothetical protein
MPLHEPEALQVLLLVLGAPARLLGAARQLLQEGEALAELAHEGALDRVGVAALRQLLQLPVQGRQGVLGGPAAGALVLLERRGLPPHGARTGAALSLDQCEQPKVDVLDGLLEVELL